MRIILDSADLQALLGGDLDLEGSATITLSPDGDVRPWVLASLRARLNGARPSPRSAMTAAEVADAMNRGDLPGVCPGPAIYRADGNMLTYEVPAPAEWQIVRIRQGGDSCPALVGHGKWVEIYEDDGADSGVPAPYSDYLWASLEEGDEIEETISEVDAETVRLAKLDDRDAIRRIVRLAFPE